MNTAIYTLTSELHDEQAVGAVTREFLNTLEIAYDYKGGDYAVPNRSSGSTTAVRHRTS